MAKKIPPKRLVVNWKAIYPLYRLGTLSNPQIAKQYEADHVNSQTHKKTVTETAIRKQAIKFGWKKDLAGAVQEKIKQKLVRAEVRDANQLPDDQIVEEAAEAGAHVIIRHRREIKGLNDIEGWLLNELTCVSGKVHISNYKGEITKTELSLTIKEKASTYRDLVSAMTQRIVLERQAHNILNNEGESGQPKRIRVRLIE